MRCQSKHPGIHDSATAAAGPSTGRDGRPLARAWRALVLCVSCATIPLAATFADERPLRSTWECLPGETVLALRIPDGRAAADALVYNTKLGAMLLKERRIEAVTDFLSEQRLSGWEEVSDSIFELGLEPGDLRKLAAHELGYAVIAATGDDDGLPIWAGAAWLAPGRELAERAFDALGRAAEFDPDPEHPVERNDIEIAGRPAIHLTLPVVALDFDAKLELPDDYHELSEEERQVARRKARERVRQNRESAEKKVTFGSLLAATVEDRLLVMHSLGAVEDRRLDDHTEQLAGVFSRLITAHQQDSVGFVARTTSQREVADIFGREGTALFELIADTRPIIRQMASRAAENPQMEKALDMFGTEGLGEIAFRMTLKDQIFHTDLFLAAAAPRRGLLQLLDQPSISADPPAWVPGNVLSYGSFSFDLAHAYDIVKGEVLAAFGDAAERGFQMAELQVRNFAQAELSDVLAALGHRHVVVSFEPDFEPRDDENALPMGRSTERAAWVWQLEDDAVWAQLLNSVATFAGTIPGVKFGEEQGFRGLRFDNAYMEGGFFQGKGYLVLASGKGVLETILSALNNPAAGDATLRGSALYQRAAAMMPWEAGLAFEVTDGNRLASATRQSLEQTLQQLEFFLSQSNASEESDHEAFFELAKELLPEQDEVDHLFGTGAGRWHVDDDGLQARSALELPPPD